ncbi:unnamed protein product [Adineta ricciae]|uniref:Uncharacterized protein n=1 Tax=Adineta ricciae TaxID=249248 RepID=A0A815MJ78_ADIRI|nr:unnamed protein product [Adineta ricciae]
MRYLYYIGYFLLKCTFAVQIGCLQNVSFSGISSGIWLNNSIDCNNCICYMLKTNSSALNCYLNTMNITNCLLFRNYSTVSGGVQVVATSNSSLACFTEFPPTSVDTTTSLPTTTQAATTVGSVCAGYVKSTVLLQLYNAANQSYIQYLYTYQATSAITTLMFCFQNQQYFWALDSVSMKDFQNSTELIRNGGFETGGWDYWTYYCSKYDGSGMRKSYLSCSPKAGSWFYLDIQYSAGDGIYQNVTTVIGRNYTISFYLANPLGGNVSVAIVSVGP